MYPDVATRMKELKETTEKTQTAKMSICIHMRPYASIYASKDAHFQKRHPTDTYCILAPFKDTGMDTTGQNQKECGDFNVE